MSVPPVMMPVASVTRTQILPALMAVSSVNPVSTTSDDLQKRVELLNHDRSLLVTRLDES